MWGMRCDAACTLLKLTPPKLCSLLLSASLFVLKATAVGGGTDGLTDYPDMAGTVGVVGKYSTIAQGLIGTSLSAHSKL